MHISYRSISPHISKLDTVQFFHLQNYFQNNEPLHCPKETLTISLDFTFYLFIIFTYPINPSLHFTLLFISTAHFPSLFAFYRLHLPSLVSSFLTLVLKIRILLWEVPIAPSSSWFQSVMDLFTKQYFPMMLCTYRLSPSTPSHRYTLCSAHTRLLSSHAAPKIPSLKLPNDAQI
jgi:hypothetical protein